LNVVCLDNKIVGKITLKYIHGNRPEDSCENLFGTIIKPAPHIRVGGIPLMPVFLA